jgi:hypothetical protein
LNFRMVDCGVACEKVEVCLKDLFRSQFVAHI